MATLIDTLLFGLLHLLPDRIGRRLHFAWRYRRGRVPWDTNQTPPEVVDFVREYEGPPGRALDLGCGTGTNVLYLARHGWQATGVDFVAQAIAQAREKASQAGLACRFLHGDVTRLDTLPLTPPFDLLLDIGCLHALPPDGRERYATHLARLTRPGADFLLYAGLPRPAHIRGQLGIEPEQVAALFASHFQVEREERGTDTGGGWPRVWYWLRRVGPD